MSIIAALVSETQHQRLVRALGEGSEVQNLGDWAALLDFVARRPVRLVIVDIFINGQGGFEGLRRLKLDWPRIVVVAYVKPDLANVRQLFDAGRKGVDALVLEGQDDAPIDLTRTLALAENRGLAAIVRRHLTGEDSVVFDAVMIAVSRAHQRMNAQSLAKQLRTPRRTVAHRLATAGFPPLQQLVSWGRLIVAAHLLDDGNRSADAVAATLDYPSGSAFRNACRRYLNMSPHQIRKAGGADFVIERFFQQRRRQPRKTPVKNEIGR